MRAVGVRAGVALLGMALVMLQPAMVAAADLTLPTDTVVYAEPGSMIELGRVPVDTERAGPLCTWQASVTNQNSAHPGNDIVITSGESELVLADVEATEGKVTTNTGSAYLVDEVVVTLRMGPDGVFSGGLDLTIRYDQCTTTTTAPPTTAPPAPTTTEGDLEPLGPTVTTAPPDTAPATPSTAAPTTSAPTTTVDIEPAGPVLPITGGNRSQPLLATGLALVGLGAVGVITTRRAAH
ncbi:MAG: hypothetical protein R2733_22585 [Acidimicrobiales bacterium]